MWEIGYKGDGGEGKDGLNGYVGLGKWWFLLWESGWKGEVMVEEMVDRGGIVG